MTHSIVCLIGFVLGVIFCKGQVVVCKALLDCVNRELDQIERIRQQARSLLAECKRENEEAKLIKEETLAALGIPTVPNHSETN